MGEGRIVLSALLACLAAIDAGAAMAQGPVDSGGEAVLEHRQGLPNFLTRMPPVEAQLSADLGLEVEFGRSARAELADHRRLVVALEALAPQRPGTVDAYVVSVAFDSDPVFGREAREAARVLGRRYGAEGRTIVLAGPDGSNTGLPHGSPSTLAAALARISELMDRQEDALILFVTAHGMPTGVVYHYGDQGFGTMSPTRLWAILAELGIANRMTIVNSCFSGAFIPALADARSVVIAASAPDRTSFGCQPSNDWTFFGDALVNRALRQPQPIAEVFEIARRKVNQWEGERGLVPSQPGMAIGRETAAWLDVLEARVPRATTPRTGRPAVTD